MRLSIGGGSGMVVSITEQKVEVFGGRPMPEAAAFARGKRDLRVRRFLLNYYHRRRQKTRHALFWLAVLVLLPASLLALHYIAEPRGPSALAPLVGLPVIAFGLLMTLGQFREMWAWDKEARRVLARHFSA